MGLAPGGQGAGPGPLDVPPWPPTGVWVATALALVCALVGGVLVWHNVSGGRGDRGAVVIVVR
ncbi:hypothetical protein GII33_05355 [Gordonia pseudamarae]|uniref:Uncharacterized protein n=1 Tax=Gordonia pseudamarae TaxID=2831662 RepID=A0ABX6IGJ3_9ACTN|nr:MULTISPECIES: hypothetical protein [Gordonia]MBD0023664.1 hypothetical protein [Gordonia sp. (in: high G+C Gram-positive bacteria)]QHN25476.1 hypothetical protein GII33_05355 [Gordonia pseudamarae]QHN34408.1 hypothetical protein GII31_05350 [Gordonia pseudamarae]